VNNLNNLYHKNFSIQKDTKSEIITQKETENLKIEDFEETNFIGETHQVRISLKLNSTFTYNSIFAYLTKAIRDKKLEKCTCQIGLRLKKRTHYHLEIDNEEIAFKLIPSKSQIILFLKQDYIRKRKFYYALQLYKNKKNNTTIIHIRLHGNENATKVRNKYELLKRVYEVCERLKKVSTKELIFKNMEIIISKNELAIRYNELYEPQTARLLSIIAIPDKENNRFTLLREAGDSGIYIYRVPIAPIKGYKSDIKTYRRQFYNTPAITLYDHPKIEVSTYRIELKDYDQVLQEQSQILQAIIKELGLLNTEIYGLKDRKRYLNAKIETKIKFTELIKNANLFLAFSNKSVKPSNKQIKAIIHLIRKNINEIRKAYMEKLLEEANKGKVFSIIAFKKALGIKKDDVLLEKIDELTEYAKVLGINLEILKPNNLALPIITNPKNTNKIQIRKEYVNGKEKKFIYIKEIDPPPPLIEIQT